MADTEKKSAKGDKAAKGGGKPEKGDKAAKPPAKRPARLDLTEQFPLDDRLGHEPRVGGAGQRLGGETQAELRRVGFAEHLQARRTITRH